MTFFHPVFAPPIFFLKCFRVLLRPAHPPKIRLKKENGGLVTHGTWGLISREKKAKKIVVKKRHPQKEIQD